MISPDDFADMKRGDKLTVLTWGRAKHVYFLEGPIEDKRSGVFFVFRDKGAAVTRLPCRQYLAEVDKMRRGWR